VGEVVKTMEGIQASSHKISDIISVIDSIAFQTNILALNAAVEAARAGEQGRGFAVVAAEVRSLAQRSANAAREIKGLITESVQRVDDGTKLAGGAGTTMNEIVSSVNRVSQLISEIAGATAEQSSGIAQANAAVSQLDKVTQQNAALVEESTAASESLRSLAVEMSEAVAVFQLASNKAAPALPSSPAQMAIKSYQARALANSGSARLANKAAAANTRLEEEWKEF
jgi:methyl-accepting chemotaxis protein